MSSPELTVFSSNGLYQVEILPESGWMSGTINTGNHRNNEQLRDEAIAVADSIEPIASGLEKSSTCTDSRERIGLEGSEHPQGVTRQTAGGILISAFAAAEELGGDFYSRPVRESDSPTRLRYVRDALVSSGFLIGSHVDCGAVKLFDAVNANGLSYATQPGYVSRVSRLVPEDIADQGYRTLAIAGRADKRVRRNLYDDYSVAAVENIVRESTGYAIEHLNDDGRGVHGHRESSISYRRHNIGNVALNPNALSANYDLQSFGVDGSLVHDIAEAVSNGSEDLYAGASYAMAHFNSAAHSALGKNLPTFLISSNDLA